MFSLRKFDIIFDWFYAITAVISIQLIAVKVGFEFRFVVNDGCVLVLYLTPEIRLLYTEYRIFV